VPAIRASLSQSWSVKGSRLTVRRLRLARLPHGVVLRLACSGRGCPLRSRTAHAAGSTLDLLKTLGRTRSFRAGQRLELRLTAAGHVTQVIRIALERGRRPRAVS
jgi:hypothetical protein